MGGFAHREPNMLDVEVSVPVDGTFGEIAELLDALTERNISVKATRLNPRYLADTGGFINPTDLVFWITVALGGGGMIAFSKRFFEHLADDTYAALKKQLVEYGKRRRERQDSRVYLQIHRHELDDKQQGLSFRWELGDDLQKLSQAALRLTREPSDVNTTYSWDERAGVWVEYDMETGLPVKATENGLQEPKRE
jgi:hypothetical protein